MSRCGNMGRRRKSLEDRLSRSPDRPSSPRTPPSQRPPAAPPHRELPTVRRVWSRRPPEGLRVRLDRMGPSAGSSSRRWRACARGARRGGSSACGYERGRWRRPPPQRAWRGSWRLRCSTTRGPSSPRGRDRRARGDTGRARAPGRRDDDRRGGWDRRGRPPDRRHRHRDRANRARRRPRDGGRGAARARAAVRHAGRGVGRARGHSRRAPAPLCRTASWTPSPAGRSR